MNCSPPGSSFHGISQAKILEWVAIFFSRGSSRARDQTCVSCIAGRCFTTEPPEKTRGNLSCSYRGSFPGCFSSPRSSYFILEWAPITQPRWHPAGIVSFLCPSSKLRAFSTRVRPGNPQECTESGPSAPVGTPSQSINRRPAAVPQPGAYLSSHLRAVETNGKNWLQVAKIHQFSSHKPVHSQQTGGSPALTEPHLLCDTR